MFALKRMGARFPEISEEEIQKLAKKEVNKNTVKTRRTWKYVRGKCLEVVRSKQGCKR